jgi:hypothetical protein
MGLGGANYGGEGRRALSDAVTRVEDSRVAEAALQVLARKGGPDLPSLLLQVSARGSDDDAAMMALGLLAEKTPFTDETAAAFAGLLKAATWTDARDRIAAAAFRFLAKDPANLRTTAFLHTLLAEPAPDDKVLGVFANEVVDRELAAFVPAMREIEARLPEGSAGRETLAWATRRMGSAEFLSAHRSLQEAVRKRESLREAFRSGALGPTREKSVADELQTLNREIDALEAKLRDF